MWSHWGSNSTLQETSYAVRYFIKLNLVDAEQNSNGFKVQGPFKLLYFFSSQGREKEPFVRKTVSGKLYMTFANVTSSKLNL